MSIFRRRESATAAPIRLRLVAFVFLSLALPLIAACGGGDDDDSAASSGASSSGGSDGAVEMVPLSSLNLDLPFELRYDPPVPSDSSVANAVEREASAATHAGYDLTLNASASYEDVKAAYDEYVAGFEFSTAIRSLRLGAGAAPRGSRASPSPSSATG